MFFEKVKSLNKKRRKQQVIKIQSLKYLVSNFKVTNFKIIFELSKFKTVSKFMSL